jgi:hypothetical protein
MNSRGGTITACPASIVRSGDDSRGRPGIQFTAMCVVTSCLIGPFLSPSRAENFVQEERLVKEFVGIVKEGKFQPLGPDESRRKRLTTIPMFATIPPENAEMRLEEYEGQTVVVEGQDQGEWIFSAKVKPHQSTGEQAPGN